MKVITSTGDAEQDAKLVAEALGQSNETSFEEAVKQQREISEAQINGSHNALTEQPRIEGQVLLVLPDDEKEPRPTGAKETQTISTQEVEKIDSSFFDKK